MKMDRKYLYLLVLCVALIAVFRRTECGTSEANTTAHLPSSDSHIYHNAPRAETSDIARRNAAVAGNTDHWKARHQAMLRKHYETNLQNNGFLAASMRREHDEARRYNEALAIRKQVEMGL